MHRARRSEPPAGPPPAVVTAAPDMASLVASIPDALLVVGRQLQLQFVNEAGVSLLGHRAEDWLGKSLLSLVHPDDVPMVVSSARTVVGKPVGTPIELRLRAVDGSWRWVEVMGRDALQVPGVEGLVITARDITDRRVWEVASGDAAVVQHLVQHGSSITLLLDRVGTVTSVNAAFTRLLGHDPSHVVGRRLAEYCVAGAASELQDAIELSIETGGISSCEVGMRHIDPAIGARPIRFEIVNLLDDPVVGGFIVSGHDVSELHRAQRSLEHLARHDALTGLANRALLIEQLERLLAEGQQVAAVFIDLDRFKPVNDLFGHEAGDELLREVSRRLHEVVRHGDLIARVGGDEFVVLAIGLEQRSSQLLCERIDAVLADPYLLADGPVRITASVGLAVADDFSTVTGLLADADLAMYDAKASRRGETINRSEQQKSAAERRRLADDLAAGLQRNEVVAHLQPLVEIATGRTVAFEALARWNHPRLGLLGPMAFLTVAEDAGLDLLVGDAVLASAAAALQHATTPLRLGVNLSVAQLTDRNLATRMAATLARHGFPAGQLTVEITERDTLPRTAGAGRVAPDRTLAELRELGATLVLDDFGTGYSSLTHIRRYTLRAVKIDGTFVAGVCDQPEDRAVIAAVVGMADALRMDVVAECVETQAQYDALAAMGCTLAQGFLIARPLPPEQVIGWLERFGGDWQRPTTT